MRTICRAHLTSWSAWSMVSLERGGPVVDVVQELRCRICRAPARLAANPYFGTGLSVHRQIQVCTRCQAISFPPRPERDEAVADTAPPVGWRARLGAWLHAH
jgi:hypothetical protein